MLLDKISHSDVPVVFDSQYVACSSYAFAIATNILYLLL